MENGSKKGIGIQGTFTGWLILIGEKIKSDD